MRAHLAPRRLFLYTVFAATVTLIGNGGRPAAGSALQEAWNRSSPPEEPRAAILGPPCGCLPADEPQSKPLSFTASATIPGGEFGEFELIPAGKPPRIVANTGGRHPQLILTGTRETGAVTLKIHYALDGRRYEAPPMRVEFCTLEAIQLDDGARDLAFDGSGELRVGARSNAWHNGEDVSAEIAWDLEEMGAPTTISSTPADARGEQVRFAYERLPEKNDSFGPKKLAAAIARGKCSCRTEETVRAFFNGADNSHPGDDTPNWFYYWSQTSAVGSAARRLLTYQEQIVDANLPGARPIAKYDPESGRLLVSRALYVENGCRPKGVRGGPDSRRNQGIDCFAETVRHEWQHREDAIDWWGTAAGPFGVSLPDWFARDWDHDQVPNRIEDAEAGCRYGSRPALTPAGGRETWFTCTRRPFADTTDAEINAYSTGWMWPTGTADKVDWSCGSRGKQWRGKTCGN